MTFVNLFCTCIKKLNRSFGIVATSPANKNIRYRDSVGIQIEKEIIFAKFATKGLLLNAIRVKFLPPTIATPSTSHANENIRYQNVASTIYERLVMISGDYHVKYHVRNSLEKTKCIYSRIF